MKSVPRKVFSIQPAPKGFFKRWKGEDGEPDMLEPVMFFAFTDETADENGRSTGFEILPISSGDMTEGCYLFDNEAKNYLGLAYEQPEE